MDFQKLKRIYQSFSKTAQHLVNDQGKTLLKLQEAVLKATKNKGSLSKIWSELQLLFSLVKDYASGDYRNVSKGSIIAVLAGLLYFISPLDLIPDFIAGLGFVDDAYILTLIYRKISKDLEKYERWKATGKNIISI
jgi:uncharacterized membrane protein YkvA (DUF1232 family)